MNKEVVRDAIVANLVREGINKHRARELADHFIGLAALQPAQRPWVGLTDAETEHLWEISRAAMPRYHTFKTLIEKTLIEKALRERNT